MKKSRISLLISNIMVYGLNQILVVLIPMIMLPIYSRLLPDISVYGISSIAITICTLVSSVATFGMYDAAVRFAFDKTENEQQYHKELCSTASFFLALTSILASTLLLIFKDVISIVFFGTKEYSQVVVIAAGMSLFTVWNTAAIIPIRIYNQKRYTILNSMIKAIATAVATLFFIKAEQYLLAIPLGTLCALGITWLITFLLFQRKYVGWKYISVSRCYVMLKYAAPLMITFVSYWIYQSADRIMLSHLSNLTEVGIYAIGAKIGAVSGVMQNAFASGWAYFAFSTMNDEDQIHLISKIFRIGIVVCCLPSMLITAVIYPILALVFVDGAYISGAFLCSTLFTAPLFLTLMQVIGTQLLIEKDTRIYSRTQVIGAVINILFNFILIPVFGARGAAVATLIGYVVPLLILCIRLKKNKKILVGMRETIVFCFTTFVLIVSTLFVYTWQTNLIIGLIGSLVIILISIKDIKMAIKAVLTYFGIKGGKENDNAK